MNNKMVHMAAFTLMALGGLNWGLVGLLNLNLVETIFGMGSMLTKVVYILVGVSTAVVLLTHQKDCKICSGK